MTKATSSAKKFSGRQLDELYEAYDKARIDVKEAEKDKKEAGDAIRERLGDIEEASTPNYSVTFRYDADKTTEVFDEELFAEKDPKKHAEYLQYLEDIKRVTKKYTKSVTTKGARKLIVTCTDE